MQDTLHVLREAVARHQAADHAAAAALYRTVLDAEPRHPRALYLYGLLLLDTGRSEDAAANLTLAADARPGDAAVLTNLVRALLAARRPAEALAIASTFSGGSDDIAFLRGTALNALGQPAAGAAVLEQVIARQPANAAAVLNLGNACADLDRLAEAEAHIRRAIELAPRLAEAHASLGFVLTSRGRLDQAIAACGTAIGLRPDFAQAHWN